MTRYEGELNDIVYAIWTISDEITKSLEPRKMESEAKHQQPDKISKIRKNQASLPHKLVHINPKNYYR